MISNLQSVRAAMTTMREGGTLAFMGHAFSGAKNLASINGMGAVMSKMNLNTVLQSKNAVFYGANALFHGANTVASVHAIYSTSKEAVKDATKAELFRMGEWCLVVNIH